MSSGSSLDSTMMYHCMVDAEEKTWNSDTWGSDAIQVVMVNIPLSMFHTNPVLWGDLKATPASVIVRTLAWIATESGLGSEYKVGDDVQRFYCGPGKPHTVQWWEELISEIEPREVVGYRLIMAVLDPSLDIRKGFKKLITSNIAREEERQQAAAYSYSRGNGKQKDVDAASVARSISGGMTRSPELRIMDPISMVNRVLVAFTEQMVNGGGRLDVTFSGDPLGKDSHYDPLSVFGKDKAFSLNLDTVCREQRTPSNYLDAPDMQGMTSFRGRFPFPDRVTRVMSQYFRPNFICGVPLPDVAKTKIGPIYARYKFCNDQLKKAREHLSAADNSANTEDLERARDAILILKNRAAREADEIDDEIEALRRSAPCAVNMMGGLLDAGNSSYVDEVILQRNDFRRLHASFTKRVEDLRAKFTEAADKRQASERPEGPLLIGGKTFQATMSETRYQMLDQFWGVYRKSPKVTMAVETARKWFSKRTGQGKSHWARHYMQCSNLSPFGNMIVRLMAFIGDSLEIETNFNLTIVTLLTVMSAHRFKMGLRPNLLVTGEGGAGKSYVVDQVKKMSVPGAVMKFTHITTHALNGEVDISGSALVMEETPLDMIGVDKWGNTVAADPYLKNRMTEGMTYTLAQDRSDDHANERKARMYISRCMVSHIFISNDTMPDKETALMSRFMQHPMRKMKRDDTKDTDRTLLTDELGDGDLSSGMDDTFDHTRLQHFYMQLWEAGIESGALPDINIDTAKQVSTWIFNGLAKRNVPRPARRHLDMMLDMCRVMQMYYGVDMELNSEYGHWKRACRSPHMKGIDKITDPDEYAEKLRMAFDDADQMPFESWMLSGLVKWSVVTEEITVFVISLLEFLWVPKVRTDIALTLGMLAGGRIDDDTRTWEPSEFETDFRREFEAMRGQNDFAPQPQPQPQAQQEEAEEGAAADAGAAAVAAPHHEPYDYRYLQICGPSYKEIVQKIRVSLKNPPSSNDIMTTMTRMANEHVSCRPKFWQDTFVETTEKDTDGNPTMKKVRKLVDVPYTSEELIPVVVMEAIPERFVTGANHRRICIAVDVINLRFGTALRDSIQEALGHKFQITQDLITAFPYQRARNLQVEVDAGSILPYAQDECMETLYNVFDTVRVERLENVQRVVENPYSRSKNELAMLLRKKFRSAAEASKRADELAASQSSTFRVNSHIDDLNVVKFWRTHGVNPAESSIAYTPRTKDMMMGIYDEYPEVFGTVDDIHVSNYPKEWVAKIDENHKTINAEDAPELGMAGGAHYFDMGQDDIESQFAEMRHGDASLDRDMRNIHDAAASLGFDPDSADGVLPTSTFNTSSIGESGINIDFESIEQKQLVRRRLFRGLKSSEKTAGKRAHAAIGDDDVDLSFVPSRSGGGDGGEEA